MMQNAGLIFIPDISGFTRFIHETELEHSRLIIQELLELLIENNTIGLSVSEIEGDAVLFYRFGTPPPIGELARQVETMFRAFHDNLRSYDVTRYCQCRACTAAVNLSLKIITHYGEFTLYNVRSFQKLLGKDVIVAHQLLKNDIGSQEYWLTTQGLLANASGAPGWTEWVEGVKKIEDHELKFVYTSLTPLKSRGPQATASAVKVGHDSQLLSITGSFDTDIITLFHASGDFRYRHRWQHGVIQAEETNHYLPRVGMKCKCVLENGEAFIYSSSYQYSDDRISFTETNETDQLITAYHLEKEGDFSTRLTIALHMPNFIRWVYFKLFRKSTFRQQLIISMQNLQSLSKEIRLPGRV